MGFTYPTTRSTGYIMGASTWNAEVVNNLRWLAGEAPSCKAAQSTPLSVPPGAPVAIGFDAELWDITGIHSNAVNNSRFTVPVAGRYQVTAYAQFPAANFYAWLSPYISGVVTEERAGMAFSSTADYGIVFTDEFLLAAGAFVEMVVWHNYSSALNITNSKCLVKWVGL